MLQDRIEPAWIDGFETVLRRCALQLGDAVAILCESQSRRVLMDLAQLAAARIGARVFTVSLPSVFSSAEPVTRSTGGSPINPQHAPVMPALVARAAP